MKLTIVANGDFFSTYGGGQVYVKNLVDELISRKESESIDLSVISIASHFPVVADSKKYRDIDLYEASPLCNFNLLLQKIAPDVVHVHGEKYRLVIACNQLKIPCVVTAHHGGILCPAGSLLNHKDQICHEPASLERCLPCYLRNIRTGKHWYCVVKHIPTRQYIRIGKRLKKLPFIPYLSPIGEAMLSIQEKIEQWNTIKEQATQIIAPSHAIAESMILNGCNKNKITVIPHGIPQPATFVPKQSLNPRPSTLNFYYVGRISYVKGVHVMLEAFSRIDNAEIGLHIIGGTGNKEEARYLKKLQHQYKSDQRIIWHGKTEPENVNEMTMDYHCLIHPTICMEIFGLNIAEALAQHKYVIATKCGGAEMQIHSAEEGQLVTPNSVSAMQSAMQSFINNPVAAHASVNTIQNHVSELLSVYRNTVSTSIE